MSRKTLKLLCVNIFLFHTILQIKGSIMPSSFSSSSPPNSPIILDSEASTIVLSDSDSDSDDSLSSSIFGFTCEICELRAKDATQLEYKYLQDDLPLLDSDGVHWGKCDACGTCVHLVCWEESIGDKIQWDNRCSSWKNPPLEKTPPFTGAQNLWLQISNSEGGAQKNGYYQDVP